MMSVTKLSISLCALLVAPPLFASSLTYTTRAGDTLSGILGNLGICPLWGKGNGVALTFGLNPEMTRNNGNFVLPNRRIKLPVEKLPESNDYQISEAKEVFFTVPRPENKCSTTYLAWQKSGEKLKDVPPTSSQDILQPTNKDSSSFGTLRVTTDFFYSAIDVVDKATDDKAQVLSRINHAYQFAWEQQWDEKNKTFIFYRTEKHDYEAVEDKLPAKSFNLQGFGVGYQRQASKRLDLRLSALTQERLFLRATSIASIQMERAMVPEIKFMPLYRIYSKGQFDLFGDLGLSYLMAGKASSYSIRPGYKYSAGLSITQTIKDFELLGRSFYSVENQDSSIITKSTRELGLSFGLAWNFGK